MLGNHGHIRLLRITVVLTISPIPLQESRRNESFPRKPYQTTIEGAGMGVRADRSHQTTRREFVLLSGAALAISRPAFADRKKPKIGFLSWFPQSMKDDLDRS